jgi:hypothetical protein
MVHAEMVSDAPADGAGPERRWRRWAIAALILLALVGLAIAASSALRMGRRGRGPPPPRQTDVGQIAGWMTVPYVSRTFRVPPEELAAAVGVPVEQTRQSSLDELARAAGRPADEVVAAVRAAVTAHQAANPAPEKPAKPGPADGPPGRGPPKA